MVLDYLLSPFYTLSQNGSEAYLAFIRLYDEGVIKVGVSQYWGGCQGDFNSIKRTLLHLPKAGVSGQPKKTLDLFHILGKR